MSLRQVFRKRLYNSFGLPDDFRCPQDLPPGRTAPLLDSLALKISSNRFTARGWVYTRTPDFMLPLYYYLLKNTIGKLQDERNRNTIYSYMFEHEIYARGHLFRRSFLQLT